MEVAETCTKTACTRREWDIIPAKDKPTHFSLKTITGHVLYALTFPGNCNATHVNLIASTLVLVAIGMQDIAEMYRNRINKQPGRKNNAIFYCYGSATPYPYTIETLLC